MREKDLCPSLFVIWDIVRVLLKRIKSEQNDDSVLFTFMFINLQQGLKLSDGHA